MEKEKEDSKHIYLLLLLTNIFILSMSFLLWILDIDDYSEGEVEHSSPETQSEEIISSKESTEEESPIIDEETRIKLIKKGILNGTIKVSEEEKNLVYSHRNDYYWSIGFLSLSILLTSIFQTRLKKQSSNLIPKSLFLFGGNILFFGKMLLAEKKFTTWIQEIDDDYREQGKDIL